MSWPGTYLDMVRDEPEALLNLGVYYWADDYSKAVRYFELATKQPRQSELARRFLQLLQREAELCWCEYSGGGESRGEISRGDGDGHEAIYIA